MGTTFATVAQVQARLDLGSVDATLIGQVLDGVTARIARYCNRMQDATNLMLRQSSFTELVQGDGGEVLQLSLFPIESITSVTYGGPSLDWTGGTVFTENTDFTVNKRTGLLTLSWSNWPQYDQSIKVVYAGGYVDPGSVPTTGQVALPNDVIEAAITQSVYDYKTRQSIGVASVNAAGGASFIKVDGLLPQVKEMLVPFRRMWI